MYDIFKTIYANHGGETDEKARIAAIQNTLSHLRVTHIATLDAILTHLTRFVALVAQDDEQYLNSLCSSLGACILRPRTESSLTQHDRHASRLLHDLFAHKQKIFSELKKMSSGSRTSRVVSTDESDRKAKVQARNRAVSAAAAAARSRESSPLQPPSSSRAVTQEAPSSASYFLDDLSPKVSSNGSTALPEAGHLSPTAPPDTPVRTPSLSRRSNYPRRDANLIRHSRSVSSQDAPGGPETFTDSDANAVRQNYEEQRRSLEEVM